MRWAAWGLQDRREHSSGGFLEKPVCACFVSYLSWWSTQTVNKHRPKTSGKVCFPGQRTNRGWHDLRNCCLIALALLQPSTGIPGPLHPLPWSCPENPSWEPTFTPFRQRQVVPQAPVPAGGSWTSSTPQRAPARLTRPWNEAGERPAFLQLVPAWLREPERPSPPGSNEVEGSGPRNIVPARS